MKIKTFYLVDFENVHSKGIENIKSLTKTEQVHIFSTKNAEKVRIDLVVLKEIDIDVDIVPVGDQSVDRHLISFLGYLLGIYGKQCAYVIVSKDKGYDNIIKFWKEKGYTDISRESEIPKTMVNHKKTIQSASSTTSKIINNKIKKETAYDLSGNDKNKLSRFIQRELSSMEYEKNDINEICEIVRKHYKKEQMLKGIHNDLGKIYIEYKEIYQDVKFILKKYESR